MKFILITMLIFFGCQSATKNAGEQQEQHSETPTYLPAVGDAALYIGATRDREMNIVKGDIDSKVDTIYIDTVYADTVIIKRISFGAVACSVRVHYFIDNFPKDEFKKVGQKLFVADSFRFKEQSKYRSIEMSNVFYNDSLKVYNNETSEMTGHKEIQKFFKGKKITGASK